jgi:hypothetical protein
VKRWQKVLLIIVIAGVAAVLAAGAGMAWWLSANRERLKAVGDAMKTEGAAFGRDHDGEACVAEAFARLDRDSGFVHEAAVKVFLGACLRAAKREPSHCDGVPGSKEIMRTVKWRMGECSRRGREGDQRCARMVAAIQESCGGR